MFVTRLIPLLRVAVLPALIYLINQHQSSSSVIAVIILSLVALSHLIDRKIPRGKIRSFLYPFADKIVVIGVLLTFTIQGSFNGIILSFLLLRDIIIGIIRWMASRDDVPLHEENHGDLITSLELGIVFSILIADFFRYDTVSAVGPAVMDGIMFIFTVIAVIVAFSSVVKQSSIYGKTIRQRKKEGHKLEQEHLVILANKRSRGYKSIYRRRLLRLFAERRNAPIFYLSNTKNMFQNVEHKIKDEKQIIIAGGDGTFESALNYRPFSKKSLGFFPLGAGNSFYSYFYKGKRFEYLRSRFEFQEMEMDILELEYNHKKTQTLFLSIGIDAEVVRYSRQRTQHGLSDYLAASWRALLHSRADYNLTCSTDGRQYQWENCINITIGKIPYYGFGVRSLLGKMKPGDRQILALACINTHALFLNKPLRLWALFLAAIHLPKSPLFPLQGTEFVVRSDQPFPLQAGGEFLGYTTDIKVTVKRRQKVLVI
ncbi:MAG: diacylglycerol kinase family protein [Nanoarchaeota archaeon]|nr:diacylglycerol kinase family protein [Nanoarchaeota archaeon]